jgi:hypothetical protein
VERGRGTRRSLGLAVVASFVAWVAPASAQIKVGEPNAVRPVAYGGVQAWLRQDTAGGRQVERLVLRTNGAVADAPIKPFPSVQGIDLGPGTAPGSIVAVYTRCSGGLFHERCSIYELDLASGREHRVSALATRRASITEPSVWGGRYAFGRVAIEGRERAGRNYGLYTGVRRATRLGSRRPGSTDVDANVVAYEGGTSGNRVQHYEIRVHRLRGKSDCRIAKSTERLGAPRNDNTVSSPVLAGGYVYWNLSGSLGTSPVRIMRVPIPGPDCKLGQVERGTVDLPPVSSGLAVDGAKVYYANSAGVFETDLPTFAPA